MPPSTSSGGRTGSTEHRAGPGRCCHQAQEAIRKINGIIAEKGRLQQSVSASRLLKKSPRAGFEAGFIAIMEADLAGERAVIVKFCKAVAAGFVHFVVTLPGEVGAAGRVGAIEAGGDATEEELAQSLGVEGNEGGLGQG